MKLLSLVVFLVSVTNGYSQTDDPFNLPSYFIKESRIKSITQYDYDNTKENYSIFDRHGNEIYNEEEDRIIEFELDYDEAGNIKQEVAIGFYHETLLKKRPVYTHEGKIDSILYELPVGMYYSGFIEKYNYDRDGRIKTVDIYSVPENDLMFTHSYTYSSGFRSELLKIRTFVGDEEKTKTLFTKKFAYDREGNLEKSSQVTAKGDTVAINFYGNKGRVLKEIVSDYYTIPSDYMYSSAYYAEALSKVQTPLTPFIIVKNLSRENYRVPTLFYIEHQYDKGKLLKSTKSVKNEKEELILLTDTYKYNDQNKLAERVTIDLNNDVTKTVRFSYDSTRRYIHMSDNSQSYLMIKRNSEKRGEELIIESFNVSWECKTTTDFDSIASTVTKKRFCKGSEGNYPMEPEQTTVASFDSFGRQIKHQTFLGLTKAPRNTSLEYEGDGQLVRYESNGHYWKYVYHSNDSTLFRQEHYSDSTYEMLEYCYRYKYDGFGNYVVDLIYVNEEDRSPFLPAVQKFDSAGRILEKEWVQVQEYSARKMNFSYNDRGLCVERRFNEWGDDEITRYEYEFY